jgi:hypothetical protein
MKFSGAMFVFTLVTQVEIYTKNAFVPRSGEILSVTRIAGYPCVRRSRPSNFYTGKCVKFMHYCIWIADFHCQVKVFNSTSINRRRVVCIGS